MGGRNGAPVAALYELPTAPCDAVRAWLLSLAAATAKGDDFGREDSSKPPPRVTRAAANQAKQIQESYKKRIKHTIKKTATGKVKRAIKRSVAAPSLGHVAKRDMEILASAGLHIRRK
eukprot:scaffold226937_cov31-Tisochrysis_lutea.AAC.1